LVEIKKPVTKLLAVKKGGENVKYRNGAWLIGQHLIGGVTQIQANCKTWLRKSFEPENADELLPQNIYTASPKGILVIGNTEELGNDRSKIESFEMFRRSISDPEIITFDELYERAKFIVEKEDNIGVVSQAGDDIES
jgi:Shedu protein SduA, C-terminal